MVREKYQIKFREYKYKTTQMCTEKCLDYINRTRVWIVGLSLHNLRYPFFNEISERITYQKPCKIKGSSHFRKIPKTILGRRKRVFGGNSFIFGNGFGKMLERIEIQMWRENGTMGRKNYKHVRGRLWIRRWFINKERDLVESKSENGLLFALQCRQLMYIIMIKR